MGQEEEALVDHLASSAIRGDAARLPQEVCSTPTPTHPPRKVPSPVPRGVRRQPLCGQQGVLLSLAQHGELCLSSQQKKVRLFCHQVSRLRFWLANMARMWEPFPRAVKPKIGQRMN